MAHTTNREAVVDRADVEVAALQHGMGKVDLAAIRQQIANQEQALTLIRATKPDPHYPQGAFTTDQVLALERENVRLMCKRRSAPTPPVATREEVQRWAEAKRLSAEQINAAHLALSSDKAILAIEGLAGAAKTTTVGAIREFAEAHGYIVRGFGMTTTAVKALRQAGLNAQTVASLLARPYHQSSGRTRD
jgi:AAA domain